MQIKDSILHFLMKINVNFCLINVFIIYVDVENIVLNKIHVV